MAVMGASLENAGIGGLALLLQQGFGAEKAAGARDVSARIV
jgi:hypothetical protein